MGENKGRYVTEVGFSFLAEDQYVLFIYIDI